MKLSTNFFVNIVLYMFIILLIFPIIVLLIWGFAKSWSWPSLLPDEFTMRAFKSIFSIGSDSLKTILYSVLLSTVVTLITIGISIPAARAIGLYEFKGKKLINILVLAPIIVPSASVAMGMHLTFISIGLANTFIGVVLVHIIPCLPYGIRILSDVFKIIGDKLEVQAKVLGANRYEVFFYITVPLIMPGIMSAASIIFIVSFSQYFLTFLIGGGAVITLPMVMFPYIQNGDRVMASSYSLIFLITTLIMLFIMEKSVKAYYKTENHFYI